MAAKALIVSAPRSGAGKTSIAIGLMRAFTKRGLRVCGVKSGPDFIDPGFHKAATYHSGFNLDSWAMEPDMIKHYLSKASSDNDLIIIEGSMGLFDGIPAGDNRTGAVADIARQFQIPVLLVLDVSGHAQTAAAIVKGFQLYDTEVPVSGIVLNRVASERHENLIKGAIEHIHCPVVGSVKRNSVPVLSERYLGLVQASEYDELENFIEKLALTVEDSLNLDKILVQAKGLNITSKSGNIFALPPPAQHIALAHDAAFTFIYPHIFNEWERTGIKITLFSPLADEAPPKECDLCWLPGGYPEIYAEQLSKAYKFKKGLQEFAQTRPVHGECGGYIVLGRFFEDAEGIKHEMTGLLSHATSLKQRKMHLGYRKAALLEDCIFGKKGEIIRGHEFHYTNILFQGDDKPFAALTDGLDRPLGFTGSRQGYVSGTFFHALSKS